MATKEKMMERVQSEKNFNPGRTRTAAGQSTPRTVQRGSGSVSPDYQKSKYAQRDAGLTGRSSAPSFSAPGFKGKARKARIHSQRVQYERERRGAADRLSEIGARGQNQRAVTGMQQAGANQRQRAGFVDALQRQQADFGQQNQQQQARFGQQNQQQQARFGQQNLQQQGRFDQQSSMDQNRFAQRNQEQQALFGQQLSMQQNRFDQQTKRDALLAEQNMLQPNKVGTIRTYQNNLGGEQRYDSRTGEDYYPFSPIPFADRLNSGQ